MKIINLSDFNHSWNWLRDEFQHVSHEWSHHSSLSVQLPKILPKRSSIARTIAAVRAVSEAKAEKALIISHGPSPAYFATSAAKLVCPDVPHLVYSFNFTNLPRGIQHKLMVKSYTQAMKFVTYSTLERSLYADYFDIPIEKIDMLHWSVHPPKVDLYEVSIESGRYICALGSQGRDYKTLFSAMKKLKHIKLVVVAHADNIRDLEIPSNVKVHTNIPLIHAQNILAHSQFMVLPLRDGQVPCGHVTIVSAMFFEKAILVTNSVGVHDYIQDGKTGLFFEPEDSNDLSRKIEMLWDDLLKASALSAAGFLFANTNCTEKTVINYFAKFLEENFTENYKI